MNKLMGIVGAVVVASAFAGCCSCKSCGEGPNVSVFANSIDKVARQHKVSTAEAAQMLYDVGVRGFDTDYSSAKLPEYAATALKPINLYGFIKFRAPDGGKAQCDAYVAAAVKYDVPRIMCVPQNFSGDPAKEEAEFQANLAGLKYLVSIAKPHGIRVMIEDFGGVQNACSRIVYLKRYLESIPELYFALDSGNLYYASRGESILEMMKFAENRIEHVHLKDQTKENHHVYTSLGLGGVENREVVTTVHAKGFDGWYTLENMVGNDELEDVSRQIGVLRYWCR